MVSPPDGNLPPLPEVTLYPGQRGPGSHTEMSDRLMVQSANEWTRSNHLQASEKAWGAFAHIVRAISAQRGWLHSRHDQIEAAGTQMASELARQDLLETVRTANDLHRNFYAHYIGLYALASAIGDIETFVDAMKGLKDAGPQPYVVKTAAAQLRLQLLPGHPPEYTIPIGSCSNVGFSRRHDDPDPGAFPAGTLPSAPGAAQVSPPTPGSGLRFRGRPQHPPNPPTADGPDIFEPSEDAGGAWVHVVGTSL